MMLWPCLLGMAGAGRTPTESRTTHTPEPRTLCLAAWCQAAAGRWRARVPSPTEVSVPPMRIGVIASVAHRTPPLHYGPWELVASLLAEGFVARGHDVTLFATADSSTRGTLCATAPHGYEEDPEVDAGVWGPLHVATAFEHADELDVLANHFDFLPLTYSRLVRTPVV